MNNIFLKINQNIVFGSLFLLGLISALFYTGINTWLFTASYIFIILCLAIVLKQRFLHPISIPINGILISSLLLLAWFAISIFPSQIKYLTIYNFFWVGSLIIVFLIYLVNDAKDEIWNFIFPGILLIVLIWAFYGLTQYYYLNVPASATFLNRNSLAALINLALIPAAGYFLLDENDRPWKKLNNKTLSSILIILFLSIFIITSRGASLSLALGFIILISILRKHIDKKQLISLFVIIFITFLLAQLSQYSIPSSPQSFTERMVSLKDTSEAGNQRFIIWESLIPLFKEMPWYGLGLGSLWVFWPPYRPAIDSSAGFFAHNDYMQILLEAGYPGLIILLCLLIFMLTSFIKILRFSSDKLTLLNRVEIVSLFSCLTTFAAHSFFTYNFYVLPLLLISGILLGRYTHLISLHFNSAKTIPPLKQYFKPFTFFISSIGIVIILSSYFLSVSLSNYYNNKAKSLMQRGNYQISNDYFTKAQKLAPLMDNPYFSHADLLYRGANSLYRINKPNKAKALTQLAHVNLNKASELNPKRPQTHHIRALIYLFDQPEKAKQELRNALKLDPRFLFSRIKLAQILHKQNNLKEAVKILYEGVEYNYPINPTMLKYMTIFAQYCREAGIESFATHLENNIKNLKQAINKPSP